MARNPPGREPGEHGPRLAIRPPTPEAGIPPVRRTICESGKIDAESQSGEGSQEKTCIPTSMS